MTRMDWPRHTPTLTDGTITLRPAQADDAEGIVAMCTDLESVRFTAVPPGYTTANAVDYISRSRENCWPEVHLVISDDTDAVLGNCSLRELDDEAAVVGIGYLVAPWARRRGVATAATRLLIDYAFAIGAFRFELDAFADNVGSRAVAKACGLTEEGVMRGARLGNGGVRHDLVRHAVLRTDRPG
ncbi:GNAT family N-acetyltransferase [Williamsia sp. CHRR-6]|uniref:GNAT family N-acetyltransferase n=1 Tax=Williamsia sp. CHRR-6 TaxID=2835871 RepID=UPI001BDAF691|nr:GNAT family protein [Williamsia sp. CHRR-6]MBT0567111.1 GNAT family N-acetyltransferase [Williamsia sp. CHRR-6]